MPSVDIYLVTTKANGTDEYHIAKCYNYPCDIPVSFGQGHCEYLYEFAENFLSCEAGDEIALMRHSVEIDSIAPGEDFTSAFKRQLDRLHDFSSAEILRSRVVMAEDKEHLRSRLRNDMITTHQSILQRSIA